MKSIRTYLIAVLLAVICLGNFIAALNGYRASLNNAQVELDQELARQAEWIRKITQQTASDSQTFLTYRSIYQVWNANGMLLRSNLAPEEPLIKDSAGYHFISFNGVRWRAFLIEDPDYRILVAEPFDEYFNLIEQLLLETIFPMVWIIPILLLLTGLVVSIGLKPLQQLSQQLQLRGVNNFNRLSLDNCPDELSNLVNSINILLSKLSDAFDREQRFASDAAHELRTPLTAAKLGLHNLNKRLLIDSSTQRDDDLIQHIHSLEINIQKMAHTIDQLLALYRLTPSNFGDSVERFDLLELVKTQIVEHYPNLQRKQQRIELEGDSIFLKANQFAISTLISNLLDNASKYSPDNGNIQVNVSMRNNEALISFEDSGAGIPEADYNRVFDRFYRVGADRHSSGVAGCGLGLSIVQHVVQLHGGRIILSQSELLGGLAVHIYLPMPSTAKGEQM